MPVICEDEEVEGENQAIGGIAGGHVDLMFFQGRSQQAEIHDAWRRCKVKTIGRGQSRVAIGTFHEFISEAGMPLRSKSGSLR